MNAHIEGVRVAGTPDGALPVVLVGVEDEEDVLPIFIGFDEATSIARGLDARDIGRPLTHDLTLDLVEELGGRIDRVVVARVEEGTYYADLHVQTPAATRSWTPARATRWRWSRAPTPHRGRRGRLRGGAPRPRAFGDLDDIREVLQSGERRGR